MVIGEAQDTVGYKTCRPLWPSAGVVEECWCPLLEPTMPVCWLSLIILFAWRNLQFGTDLSAELPCHLHLFFLAATFLIQVIITHHMDCAGNPCLLSSSPLSIQETHELVHTGADDVTSFSRTAQSFPIIFGIRSNRFPKPYKAAQLYPDYPHILNISPLAPPSLALP